MIIQLNPEQSFTWTIQKVAVIGPYQYVLPIIQRLTKARFKIGYKEPASILLFQPPNKHNGQQSTGKTPSQIPALPDTAAAEKRLYHTQDYQDLSDADVILIYLPLQKKTNSYEPDYQPMLEILSNLAEALQRKPADQVPLLIFESTFAPSAMLSIVKDHFEDYELTEGRDLLLGYSPNRKMPEQADAMDAQPNKLVAGLHPETSRMLSHLYRQAGYQGQLLPTNCMTAEVIQTLSNACRKVWVAFSREVVRYCDLKDINFFALREQVNEQLRRAQQSNKILNKDMLPSLDELSAPLKSDDDLLLWWRKIDSGADIANSLFLQSRQINRWTANQTIELMEHRFGNIHRQHIALLGKILHVDHQGTRNTPTAELAWKLLKKGGQVSLYDPSIQNNLPGKFPYALDRHLSLQLGEALERAHYVVIGSAHNSYSEVINLLSKAPYLKGVLDTCNLYSASQVEPLRGRYVGMGKGHQMPTKDFIRFVYRSCLTVATGLANETQELIRFLNRQFVSDTFNLIHFPEVQRLAALYDESCIIGSPGEIREVPEYQDFSFHLPSCAGAHRYEEV